MAWAVDLGVQITDVGRRLYIGSFCPAMTSLSRCLEEAEVTEVTEVISTPTRPVDNVVIRTKGLQDRNIHIFDGTTVENKGKLILIDNDCCAKE